MTSEYSVGYGKPPVATQFKKGKSGNPKGRQRPVPVLDLQRIFVDELKSKIAIVEGGKKRKISKLQALFKSTITRALQGDRAITKLVLETINKLPKNAFDDDDMAFKVTKANMAALEQFIDSTSRFNALEKEQAEARQSGAGSLQSSDGIERNFGFK